ncbi:hypothetical protein GQ457_09G001210 [Hibiscus cannabinus]
MIISLVFLALFIRAEANCKTGCSLAFASYYVWQGSNLTYISTVFNKRIPEILVYNPHVSNPDEIYVGTRINVPFSCDCLHGGFLGHTFGYFTQLGDTYRDIAGKAYANLTTEDWVRRVNVYNDTMIPDHVIINVTVNCSCGDRRVSKDYGSFLTYPIRPGEGLSVVAAEANVSAEVIGRYNPGVDFTAGSGLIFVPAKGISSRAIAGISIAGFAGALLLGLFIYVGVYRRRKVTEALPDPDIQRRRGRIVLKPANDLQKAAIKKMDMQASKQFLAELKVLTHVHHLNLVRLIGYCVEGSLFLVYEFIENGNLSQHLRQKDRDPLSWSARVQIALDSARGLEYIHEHTVPIYIHRDIKSANILIDKNFRAKVADFGLTKLTEFGNTSMQTRLVGTFGYMPPEYAQYGDVSPKVDVYAFGVVLYELISAREAVVKTNEEVTESTGLIALMAHLAQSCTQENPQLRPSMRSLVVALMTLSSSTEDSDVGSLYENKALFNLVSGR